MEYYWYAIIMYPSSVTKYRAIRNQEYLLGTPVVAKYKEITFQKIIQRL